MRPSSGATFGLQNNFYDGTTDDDAGVTVMSATVVVLARDWLAGQTCLILRVASGRLVSCKHLT